MITNKQLSLAVGVGVAVIFLATLPEALKSLGEIKGRQIAANEHLVEWKASYEALLPVNDGFAAVYPSGEEAKDLVSLYRLLNIERHRLMADIDLVRQTAASAVEVNGMPIGLQRLCVSNEGLSMAVSANSIRDLRLGLRSLSARRDIEMGTLEVAINDGRAIAKIQDMCLKVRTEKDSSAEGHAWASR